MLRLVLAVLVALCCSQVAEATDFGKTPEIRALGRALFFDKRLSANGTVSCATCHVPELGYSDGLILAVGNFGLSGNRHTPSLFAVSDQVLQFPDGRTVGTVTQARQPLTNSVEMGTYRFRDDGTPIVQTVGQVMARIRRDDDYVRLFAKAFPDLARQADRQGNLSVLINQTTYGIAVAGFQEGLKSRNAPIDKRMAGYTTAFSDLGYEKSEQAERGYQLFTTIGCMDCHSGPDFTDNEFHNTGVTFFTNETGQDSLGRFAIVDPSIRQPSDVRSFKTASLREVAISKPYMHNGRLATMRDVLEAYNKGHRVRGIKDRYSDPRIQPLGLTTDELDDLEVFMLFAFTDPQQSWLITEPVQP